MKLKALITLLVSYFFYSIVVWIYADPNEVKPTAAEKKSIERGQALWQLKNCQGCHQLYGLGGYMGPDLTNICSDSLKPATYIKVFVQYGSAKMPRFDLNDQQCEDILSFLKWVDQSGRSRVESSQVTWTGNYNF